MKSEECKENLFVETFLGRRRNFSDVSEETIKDKNRITRQAINYIIQVFFK